MTKIVGHRGARNLWPENSLEGFRKTLALPVDAIEFDVHLTDAGELVVIHDATLDRTVEQSGKVSLLTPSSRLHTRLKGSGEPVPTLDEVFSLFAASRPVELHVELKANSEGVPYEGLEAQAAAAIHRHGLVGRSLLTSFNLDVLGRCKQVAPEIGRLCSINAKSAEARGAVRTMTDAAELADILAIEKTLLAATFQEAVAVTSLERLCSWVLNEEGDIGHWLEQGVGWITSDDPALALSVRDASREPTA